MSKPIVLVVEDDQFLSEMYATKLRLEGFSVMLAQDGDAALVETVQHHPDCVLLDLMLPKRDGFSVLEELQKNPVTKIIPVIILSNLGEKENIDRAMRLGARDYLIKAHYLPTEVVVKIRQLLGIMS